MEFMDRTKTLDPDARNVLLVKETNERFETLCVSPFRAVVGPNVPHIAVSSKFLTNFFLNLCLQSRLQLRKSMMVP